jgi:GDP-L-fucose synthase
MSTAGSIFDDSSDKVILVTGGSGLVGYGVRSVTEAEPKANEKWIFVGSKEGDLRSLEATKALFELHKPTHCLHLAAFVGGLFRNLKYKVCSHPLIIRSRMTLRCGSLFKVDFYRDNVQMNDNVMECCREYNVSALLRAAFCMLLTSTILS